MTLLTRAVASFAGRKSASPVMQTWNWAMPGIGPTAWGDRHGLNWSYAELYRRQLWVNAVVNKLARGIGRLPLKVYQRQANGDRERDTTSALARLLANPAPRVSPTQFKQAIITDLAVYGNALAIKVGPRGQLPTQLLTVPPGNWTLAADGTYRWHAPDGQQREYQPWQVIHWYHYAPDNNGFGLSPMEPLRMTLAIEYGAQRLGVASFENGARPSGALQTDQDLKPETITRLKTEVTALHGGVDRAFKPAILTNGLKWQPLSWNLNESAVVDHRKLSREEVCAAYDVPPPLVGILDHATFSNIEEQHLMLYMDTLGPWLTLFEETLQTQLLAGLAGYQDSFAEFDLAEVLKGNIQARYDALNKAVGGPWMAANEARRVENLPRSSQREADLVRFPLNMSSDPSAAASAPRPAPNDHLATPAAPAGGN